MAMFARALFRSYPALISRNFHASNAMRSDEFQKMMFRLSGFNKFGLLADDLLPETDADVFEAIRRLPEDVAMQRTYRAIRAQQAELNNSLLPKEEWTSFEDNHHYLQPYLEEVRKERQEREAWEATH